MGGTTEEVDVGIEIVLVGLGLPRLQAKAGIRKLINTIRNASLLVFTFFSP